MSKRKIYFYSGLALIALFAWMLSGSNELNDEFSEITKVSLRDVGHQLLLSNQDSTSLVLPVIEIDRSNYRLSFETNLTFEPGNFVAIVQQSFQKASLPEHYRVEVRQCMDNEVVYSYEMKYDKEESIIPCRGRFLPLNCYTIDVKFIDNAISTFNKRIFLYFLIILVIIFLLDYFIFSKRKKSGSGEYNEQYTSIGSFQFYPDQNKLVKQAVEINLSKKECELLAIFIAKPNQIIKRDELTKKVWEDHGVIVGRSLDTYISKLRKKLHEDDSIKLTNVHGIGYKLEIS